jgi:hypothetical protein
LTFYQQSKGNTVITLRIKGSGEYVGTLSESQLQYLIDELEEEHSQDQDYWLHRSQVDIFKEKNADPALIEMLEKALGNSDDVEVVWDKS